MTGARNAQPSLVAALATAKAVLLDLDGTLVHSEDVHRQSWQALFDAWGVSVTDSDYEQRYKGRRPADVLTGVPGPWAVGDVDHVVATMTDFILARAQSIPVVPGAADLIRHLHGQGVPVAVVTSAGTVWAERILDGVLKVRDLVDVVVTSEQTAHGKPSPEGYLAACRMLGVAPEQCMAFEDSPSGVRALTAAGVRHIVGVTTTTTAAELVRAGARWTSPRLAHASLRRATIAPGEVPAPASQRPRKYASMTTLEVALIGAGFIARTHLPAWTALGARVRIYSTDDQAARLADDFGALAAASLAQALEGALVADVCTPTATHREIAQAALRAGAHVMCEKPLALTSDDAHAMADAAAQAGRRLFPAHVVRYFPAYARARQLILDGELGRVAVARFTRAGRYPTWSPWFADSALSGGILTDQMLHDMDIARWLFGDVVRVHATQRGHHTALAHKEPVAAGCATLTHASGVITQVQGLWGPPATQFQYTFHIAGSNGTLTHDSLAHPALRLTTSSPDEADGVPTGDWGEDPFLAQIRDIATACSGGPAPRASTYDGVAAVQLAEAARRSAATGRAIDLPAPAAPLAEEVNR